MPTIRLFLTLALVAVNSGGARAADAYWQDVARDIAAAVGAVVARFEAGDARAARQGLTEAYFGQFEDRKMEAAIRKEIGQARAIEVEGLFSELRKALKGGDRAAVMRSAASLHRALAADGKALDAAAVPPEVYEAEQ